MTSRSEAAIPAARPRSALRPGLFFPLLLAGAAALAAARADAASAVTAEIADAAGKAVGTATVTEAPGAAGLIVVVDLTGLPPGVHAIHVHETGKCEAPKFESSGGHLAGGKEHGVLNPAGAHAGDMTNIIVGEGGSVKAELMVHSPLADVMDADGSALVIHAGADDHMSQPAGNSGDRIACGVLMAK